MDNGKSRLQKTQHELEEVKTIMQDNKVKVDKRAGELKDLVVKADQLQEECKKFERNTSLLKNQENKKKKKKKMTITFIVIGVVAAVIGLVIGLVIIPIL